MTEGESTAQMNSTKMEEFVKEWVQQSSINL